MEAGGWGEEAGQGGSDDWRVERASREPPSLGGILKRAALFSILRRCSFPALSLPQAFSKPQIHMRVLSPRNLGRTKAEDLLCPTVWAGTGEGGGKDPWEEI